MCLFLADEYPRLTSLVAGHLHQRGEEHDRRTGVGRGDGAQEGAVEPEGAQGQAGEYQVFSPGRIGRVLTP